MGYESKVFLSYVVSAFLDKALGHQGAKVHVMIQTESQLKLFGQGSFGILTCIIPLSESDKG